MGKINLLIFEVIPYLCQQTHTHSHKGWEVSLNVRPSMSFLLGHKIIQDFFFKSSILKLLYSILLDDKELPFFIYTP